MKTGEAIHTGMRVWDREGRIWKVLSIITGRNHAVLLEAAISGPLMMATEVPFDTFVKDYYRRRTGLEHSEKLDLEAPVYEGPAKGYHFIRVNYERDGTTRIPDRVRRSKEAIRAELEAKRPEVGSYAEWYERAKPEGAWALILDPPF